MVFSFKDQNVPSRTTRTRVTKTQPFVRPCHWRGWLKLAVYRCYFCLVNLMKTTWLLAVAVGARVLSPYKTSLSTPSPKSSWRPNPWNSQSRQPEPFLSPQDQVAWNASCRSADMDCLNWTYLTTCCCFATFLSQEYTEILSTIECLL